MPPSCAPIVSVVVIVTGETPWCQDPEPDIVNHHNTTATSGGSLHSLSSAGTIFVRLSLTKSHPWWHFACWMSQDHRKQDLIIIFKEQPGCAFIKHQMVICIFRNIPTILHPFVEKSVNQPWAPWRGIKCVQFNIPSWEFQGLVGEYFPNNWKQSATRPASYCPHSDNEPMMLWPG